MSSRAPSRRLVPALDWLADEGLAMLDLCSADNGQSLLLAFATNVCPKYSNAFDSLAEIHALRGETSKAIDNDEASLRLLQADPSADKSLVEATNTRVRASIERLRRLQTRARHHAP